MPEAHYQIKADDPHWSRHFARRFYTQNHGYESFTHIYAAVELEVTLDENNQPTVTVTYTANFDNTRDLVPGPRKAIQK